MAEDVRYDTATMRAYAANLCALFNELRRGGMDRKEAIAIVIAFMNLAKETA